ncbi:MAG: hypothetical protein EBR82_79360 [Caulobacteraceae bacterium]|nr:hypothetical protein [Caulobacteraceae bacterium]
MARAKKDELNELKRLVRRFLKVTACVPFRPCDLNGTQEEARDLLYELQDASRPSKKRSKASK